MYPSTHFYEHGFADERETHQSLKLDDVNMNIGQKQLKVSEDIRKIN